MPTIDRLDPTSPTYQKTIRRMQGEIDSLWRLVNLKSSNGGQTSGDNILGGGDIGTISQGTNPSTGGVTALDDAPLSLRALNDPANYLIYNSVSGAADLSGSSGVTLRSSSSAVANFYESGISLNKPTTATALTLSGTLSGTTTAFSGVVAAGGTGGDAFRVGDDAFLVDVGAANTFSVQGAQSRTTGAIQFGQSGPTISGGASSLTTAGTFTSSASGTALNASNGGISAATTVSAGTALSAGTTVSAGTTISSVGNATLNNALVGDVGLGATLAALVHKDAANKTTSYALSSSSVGNTVLNAADSVSMRRANVDRMVISSTGIRVGDNTTPRGFFDVAGRAVIGVGAQSLDLMAGAGQDFTFMGLYARAAAPTQRTGMFGYLTTGTTTLSLQNELVNGDINFVTDGTGRTKVNGQRIYRAGQGRADGVVEADIAFDTIMGAAGPGVGSLGFQAVYGYNIQDSAVTFDKLSLGAKAFIETSPVQTRNGFTRFVTSPTTGQQDTAGNSIGNLTTSAALVADGLAYSGFALKATSGTTANNTVILAGPYYGFNSDTTKSRLQFPNQGPGLAPGSYRATVYARVSSAASAINTAMTIGVKDTRGTSVIVQNNTTTSFTPSQFGSTNYVGLSVLFTVAADTYSTTAGQGVYIEARYNTAAAVDVWISHVVVEPVNSLAPLEVTTTFLGNLSVTSGKINDLSVTKLTAGTINTDDIFLGPSGKIYAGPSKIGARVEMTSAGIASYSSVNLLPAAAQSFEDGTVGGWTARNTATLANSTAFALVGTRSLSVTASASLAGAQYNVTGLTIGQRYTFAVSAYVTAASLNLRMDVDNQALDSSAQIAMTASTWTRIPLSFTASATSHNVRLFFSTVPAANSVFYVDAAQFEGGATNNAYTSNTSPIRTIFNLTNNGNFSLNSPGPDTAARMLMDPTGIEFYNATGLTVDLDAATGTFTLQNNTGTTSVMRLDNSGLNLYTAGGVNTVSLQNTGAFTLQSATAGTRMEITSAGIKGYNGTTVITNLDSATGALSLIEGTVGGNRLELDTAGLRLYKGAALQVNLATSTGDGSFTGTITATAGSIGGFTINSTEGLFSGTGATRVQMKSGAGFWAGADARDSAPFRVTQAGVMTANDCTINGNSFLRGNVYVRGHIEVGGPASAGDGDDNYVIVRHPSSGQWVMMDGRRTDLFPYALNSSTGRFLVDYDGNLTATSANISGLIKSGTGSQRVEIGDFGGTDLRFWHNAAESFPGYIDNRSQLISGALAGTLVIATSAYNGQDTARIEMRGVNATGGVGRRITMHGGITVFGTITSDSTISSGGDISAGAAVYSQLGVFDNSGYDGQWGFSTSRGMRCGGARLYFGNTTRQMIHLYDIGNTTGGYGIGVQDNTTYFRSSGATGTNNIFAWHQGGAHSDTNNDPGAGGTVRMRLTGNGQLHTTTGSITTSAQRFKKNIVTMGPAMEKVMGLRPVTYDLLNTVDLGPQPGFVAEEAVDVLPDLIFRDKDGQIEAMNYSGVIPYLVKAFQEAMASVAAMKTEMAEMRRAAAGTTKAP